VKFVNFSNKKSLNNRHSSGFALPTILIASIIMLMVLVAALSSASSVRMAINAQYYNQLSQTAADAGTVYANACLDLNNGAPQWSDANPLKPNTDCYGVQLVGFTCPVASIEPRCYVLINSGVISSFSVSKPELDIYGKVVNLNVKGFVNLTRTSDGSVWRSYSQSNNTKNSYPGIVTNGLIMNLDAGDPLSYSGNGTGWTDLSGYNNNAVLVNGVGYSSGSGGSLTFDGIDDYAIADKRNLEITNAFTASGWMKFDKYAYMQNITSGAFNFKWRTSGNYPYWNLYDATGVYVGATAYTVIPALNEWHYYTFTYNGSYRRIYLDGVLNNEIVSASGNVSSLNIFTITATSGGEKMSGAISNITVYNRALLASEIQQNFKSLKNRY